MLLFPDGLVGTRRERAATLPVRGGACGIERSTADGRCARTQRPRRATAAAPTGHRGATACARPTARWSRSTGRSHRRAAARSTAGRPQRLGQDDAAQRDLRLRRALDDGQRSRSSATTRPGLPAYRTRAARRRPHLPDAARVRGADDLGEPADRRGLRPRPASRRLAAASAASERTRPGRTQRPDFLPHAQRRLLEVLRVIAMDCRHAAAGRAGRGPVAGRAARIRDAAAPSCATSSARPWSWSSTTSTSSGASRTGSRVLDAGAVIADGAPDEIVERSAGAQRCSRRAKRRCLRCATSHSGYGRVPVLHGIDSRCSPAKIVLVLGENGAGKTTLHAHDRGLHQADARHGACWTAGHHRAAPEELRARGCAWCSTAIACFPELTRGRQYPPRRRDPARRAPISSSSPARCSICSRSCARSCVPRRAICPAASSRCWRWRRPSSRGPRCCSATSPRSGSRRRCCRRSSSS